MVKKIVLVLLCILCILSAGPVFCAETATTTMPSPISPEITSVSDTMAATLKPALYPDFPSFSSDNPTCGNYFKVKYSAKGSVTPSPKNSAYLSPDPKNNGLSLAPAYLVSYYGKGGPLLTEGEYEEFQPIGKGLKLNLGDKLKEYSTTKINFTWAVRIEGYRPATGAYNSDGAMIVFPNLCSSWHGTSNQEYPGGNVETRLFIGGEDMVKAGKCNTCIMTVPKVTGASITNKADPTLTCSCVIGQDDIGGFTGKTAEVKWQNRTPLQIEAPDGVQRTLAALLLPITKEQK